VSVEQLDVVWSGRLEYILHDWSLVAGTYIMGSLF